MKREKGRASAAFFLWRGPDHGHGSPQSMSFRFQCVPATPAESDRSAPLMLSILSTPVNPNDFKWMQQTTQAKKHNFPTLCLKNGANRPGSASGAEIHFPTEEAVLCVSCVLRGGPSYRWNQIKCVPATQAESNGSAPAALSMLSTQVKSNDFKWIQNTTQAKKHNFPKPLPQKRCKSPGKARGEFPEKEDVLRALCALRGGSVAAP
jgi:hypothetical protein